MSMATLQLYKNPYMYPHYGNITAYGSSKPCTPVGTGLKEGTIRVEGNMNDFMSCNYLAITRNNKTIYGWIEDVNYLNRGTYNVTYRVDALRTYRGNISLGNQFVARSSQVTYKHDGLLGSTRPYPVKKTITHTFGSSSLKRVFVVQVRRGTGEGTSNTPVQPSPYHFYFMEYYTNNWRSNTNLVNFIVALTESGETDNIVTVYSIPYMDISDLTDASIPIKVGGDVVYQASGFKMLTSETGLATKLSRKADITLGNDIDKDELMRVNHTVQVVIPEGGVINLPSELVREGDLKLRQDIDLFSGASNYMVVNGTGKYYDLSVRGSSISSIPIISDPMDTYISQNQNALATSLIGDVASIGIGAGMALGSGGVGALAGGGSIMSGVSGILSRRASILDSGTRFSNPPAFLGTALANNFNGRFWVVVTYDGVDNASTVHSEFGYPMEKVMPVSFPSSGQYLKTEGCNVSSDGTVPRWAIEEINGIFDNGIRVH